MKQDKNRFSFLQFSKIFITVFASCCMFTAHTQADRGWVCGDDALTNLQKKIVPNFNELERNLNLNLREYINSVYMSKDQPVLLDNDPDDSTITIPVVVHILYPAGESYGTGANISYAQVRSQLDALNAAFSRSYPSYNNQSHPAYAQNTHIRFCLARVPSPQSTSWATGPGGVEYGVKRYPVNATVYEHNISATSANQLLSITHPSSGYFPFDQYLNIWLVKNIGEGGVMGYAPRPINPGYPLDGVVLRADIFGDNTTGANYPLGFGLAQGKVLAHEVGHYLNLYHIFQGGCAGANGPGAAVDACDLNGDLICDIEPTSVQNVFCSTTDYNTCTANYNAGTTTSDMIEDYMSYADDDCMNTFTRDQSLRMWATLKLQRSTLWQTSNLAATGVLSANGCIPPYLNASITTNNSVFCAGRQVTFSNPTQGNTATTYRWLFPGGTPATANTNTVTVSYNTPGTYKAILTVSDSTYTRSDSLSLNIITCRLDSSLLYMSHWYFGTYASLDFSSGAPVQTTIALTKNTMQGESTYQGQLPYVQGTVSLSDSSGKLLFYSNGVSVWNSEHKKISPAPIFGASDINMTTGISYIPFPGQPGKYFIAGVYPALSGQTSRVRFVLVDVTTNTVSTFKELQHASLPNIFSQFLTVVPHCNGTDYWIITKAQGADTRFFSFLVTEAGIDELQIPVVSTGFSHPGYGGSGNQLKANRKGDKLMLASPHGYLNIEAGVLYDFDSRTGQVKNERKIPNVVGYNNVQSGTAFSPNGEYVYLMRSSNLQTNGLPYWLFQYRVSDLQYNIIPTTGFYFAYPFQPGPDNQLYIVNGFNYLARLSDPDKWGGATFNGEFINLKQPSQNIFAGTSLPAFIDAKRQLPTNPDFSIEPTDCNTFGFSSLCFDKYKATWNFGDGAPEQTGHVVVHKYDKAGEFTVTLTLSDDLATIGTASKKLSALSLQTSITGPSAVCSNDLYASQFYAPIVPGIAYKWTAINGSISGPDNMPYVDVVWNHSKSEGLLILEVSRDKCILRTTKTITLIPSAKIDWTLIDSVCIDDPQITLAAKPSGGIYRGPGMSGITFSPKLAGIGTHKLTYAYSNELTCLNQVEKIIKVSPCNYQPSSARDCREMFNSIQVLSNPENSTLVLKSPFRLKRIELYNALGQKLVAGELQNNTLSLPFLAAGVYFAVVYCEINGSFKTFRFMKLN